jgi:hypothetical protein
LRPALLRPCLKNNNKKETRKLKDPKPKRKQQRGNK